MSSVLKSERGIETKREDGCGENNRNTPLACEDVSKRIEMQFFESGESLNI